MSLLGKVKTAVAKVQGNDDLNELRFRHTATWSDTTQCRFSVQDPSKIEGTLARSLRDRPDAADLRILKVHQGDTAPGLAAHIPWDNGGVLFVEHFPQQSDFLDSHVAVCLLVHPERSVSHELLFTLPGPLVKDPVSKNMVASPGWPLGLSARLEATTDPQVRDAVGADTATVVLFGRWGVAGHPRDWPVGLHWGSSSPLELQGQPGVLTLKLAWPDADPVKPFIHGAPFVATWRAS